MIAIYFPSMHPNMFDNAPFLFLAHIHTDVVGVVGPFDCNHLSSSSSLLARRSALLYILNIYFNIIISLQRGDVRCASG